MTTVDIYFLYRPVGTRRLVKIATRDFAQNLRSCANVLKCAKVCKSYVLSLR